MPKSRRIGLGAGSALALSVAAHLALFPFVRVARASAAPERTPPPDVVRFVRPPPLPPPPTAQPTPVPAPPPRRFVAAPRPATAHAVLLPRARAVAEHAPAEAAGGRAGARASRISGGSGDAFANAAAVASPDVTGTPSEAPTSTPKPACDVPSAAAHVTALAEPEMPDLARERQAYGVVEVRVDLGERGDVLATSIASSPNALLNAAALEAARRSTYAPEIVDCRPAAGSYLFRVDFDG